MKRFELSINSKNSGDSIINIKDLVTKNHELDLEGFAITDYNDINSFYEIKKVLSNYPNINYIYGTKVKVNYKGLKIIIDILVKNNEGLNNLYEILTMINSDKYNDDIYEVFNYSKGLFMGLNVCNKNIYELLDTMLDEDIYEFIKVFDYLLVNPIKDHDYIKHIVKISNTYHKFLVATSNPKYLNKEDKKYYERYIKKELECNNHLMSTKELLEEFNYLDDKDKENIIINNPHKIFLLCKNIEFISNKDIYKDDYLTKLKDIVYEKANILYENKIPDDIKERINNELALINNFNAFNLLVNSELVKLSNDLGYETTSRGNVVSFYINYLLGITKINPLDYNLDYHNFINNINNNIVIGINYDCRVISNLKNYLSEHYNIVRCGTVKKTSNSYLDTNYKKLSEEEKNNLLDIKLKNGKLVSNYYILPKDISPLKISPLIDLCDLTTMIEYHNLNKNVIRIFIAELVSIELYNELIKALKITRINLNDSKVWDSINKNPLEEIINISIKNKVSNILELAEEWRVTHSDADYNPKISSGIEYAILYYKLAYIKHYHEEIFNEIKNKYYI